MSFLGDLDENDRDITLEEDFYSFSNNAQTEFDVVTFLKDKSHLLSNINGEIGRVQIYLKVTKEIIKTLPALRNLPLPGSREGVITSDILTIETHLLNALVSSNGRVRDVAIVMQNAAKLLNASKGTPDVVNTVSELLKKLINDVEKDCNDLRKIHLSVVGFVVQNIEWICENILAKRKENLSLTRYTNSSVQKAITTIASIKKLLDETEYIQLAQAELADEAEGFMSFLYVLKKRLNHKDFQQEQQKIREKFRKMKSCIQNALQTKKRARKHPVKTLQFEFCFWEWVREEQITRVTTEKTDKNAQIQFYSSVVSKKIESIKLDPMLNPTEKQTLAIKTLEEEETKINSLLFENQQKLEAYLDEKGEKYLRIIQIEKEIDTHLNELVEIENNINISGPDRSLFNCVIATYGFFRSTADPGCVLMPLISLFKHISSNCQTIEKLIDTHNSCYIFLGTSSMVADYEIILQLADVLQSLSAKM